VCEIVALTRCRDEPTRRGDQSEVGDLRGLKGKTAVVFGATSGIGAATARRLADEGCNVVLAGRRVSEGEAVAADIGGHGGQAVFFHCDISVESDVEETVAQAIVRYGSLDLGVNNAAAIGPGSISDATGEQFETVFNTNVKGTIHCLKYEVRAMAEAGGAIVNVNSNGGFIPVLGNAVYGASKRGVTGLTQSVAYEYGPANIRVNEIAPGATRTEMLEDWIRQASEDGITIDDFAATNALRRISDPWEQAAAIAFLLSDEAAFITGVTLPTDGGSVLVTRAVPTAGGTPPTLPGDLILARRAKLE